MKVKIGLVFGDLLLLLNTIHKTIQRKTEWKLKQLTRRRPKCQSAVNGQVTLRGSSISTSSRGLCPLCWGWAQSAGTCEESWRLQKRTRHTGLDASALHSAMCPSSTLYSVSLLFSDSESFLCCFPADLNFLCPFQQCPHESHSDSWNSACFLPLFPRVFLTPRLFVFILHLLALFSTCWCLS